MRVGLSGVEAALLRVRCPSGVEATAADAMAGTKERGQRGASEGLGGPRAPHPRMNGGREGGSEGRTSPLRGPADGVAKPSQGSPARRCSSSKAPPKGGPNEPEKRPPRAPAASKSRPSLLHERA